MQGLAWPRAGAHSTCERWERVSIDVVRGHVYGAAGGLTAFFSFQSQYKFVCEAILRVYEEGLVQMLDPS